MNQWLGDNRYRRYPFVQDAVLPFGDSILVDAQMVLSTKFDVSDVQLVSITTGTNSLALVFSILSTPLAGYTLETTISTLDPDEMRYTLALKLSGVAHPELGYGFIMVGSPAAAATAVTTGSLTAKIDRSVLRYSVSHEALQVRVANKLRAGGAAVSYTGGTPDPFGVRLLSEVTAADCNEHATVPVATQRQMSPNVRGNSTTFVSVPAPAGSHTTLADAGTHTITTTPATPTTTIPTLPGDRDADVDVGVVASTIVVSNGYNMKLSGDVTEKVVQFNYQLGGGLGMDCAGILGYGSVTKSKDCVKSINGVYPASQDLLVTASAGVAVLPDQNGHRLVLVINPLNLKRVAP